MSAAAGADKAKDNPRAKGGKGRLILVGVVVLLAAIGAGGWFSGTIPKLLHKDIAEAEAHGSGHNEAAAKDAPVFLDVPEIVANLNSGARRAVFLKLKAKLELARPEDQAPVLAAMPRVLDLFQGYLREMRPEELRGTAATYRLREELAARTNIAAAPARVLGVLFVEMIVQ